MIHRVDRGLVVFLTLLPSVVLLSLLADSRTNPTIIFSTVLLVIGIVAVEVRHPKTGGAVIAAAGIVGSLHGAWEGRGWMPVIAIGTLAVLVGLVIHLDALKNESREAIRRARDSTGKGN